MLPVEQPFKVYTGLDGKPLDNGSVYFGQPNQNPVTAPVTVYWDAAGTQAAAQPLRTENGYIVRVRGGTPANVFYDSSYSELVRDHKGQQVFYARTSDDFSIATTVLNFIANLAANTGSSLIGLSNGQTLQQYLDILAFGVADIKAPATAAQIQAVIDAAPGGIIRFHGEFTISTPITLKNGLIYEGLGVDLDGGGTKFNYTGTGDAFVIANPLNSSTSANIEIRGIWFSSSSLTADNALLFDTGSSVVIVRRCRFNSSGIGITLDQSELWDIELCSFNCATGIWLVNGPDKQIGSNAFFTNRIGVHSCEFNGGSTAVGVYDDGGTAHTYENINFNACANHIIATDVNGLKIDGGEYEISSAQTIICGLTKRKGDAGGKSPVVSINRTFLYNNVDQPVLAMVAGAVGKLEFSNNVINTPAGTALSGLAVGCDEIDARGNVQVGAGSGNALINNYIDVNPAIVGWHATTTAPTIGNGTLVGSYSRRGKILTLRQLVAFGSTTTNGVGGYLFPLPFAADTSLFSELGAAYIQIPGVGVYTGSARVTADGLNVEIYVSTTGLVGAASPGAWAVGSTIEFQITYVTAAPI